jgi:hypothetical protein
VRLAAAAAPGAAPGRSAGCAGAHDTPCTWASAQTRLCHQQNCTPRAKETAVSSVSDKQQRGGAYARGRRWCQEAAAEGGDARRLEAQQGAQQSEEQRRGAWHVRCSRRRLAAVTGAHILGGGGVRSPRQHLVCGDASRLTFFQVHARSACPVEHSSCHHGRGHAHSCVWRVTGSLCVHPERSQLQLSAPQVWRPQHRSAELNRHTGHAARAGIPGGTCAEAGDRRVEGARLGAPNVCWCPAGLWPGQRPNGAVRPWPGTPLAPAAVPQGHTRAESRPGRC